MADGQVQVLALVRDLMFSGRIGAEARAQGAQCRIIRDPAALAAADGAAGLLIVDLNLPGAVAAAASWRASHGKPVVGFVSHVDAGTIVEAKTAGIDQVMPRSRFVQVLPDLLRVE